MGLSTHNLLQSKLSKKYSGIQTAIVSIWFGTIMLFLFMPNSVGEIKSAPLIQIMYLIILGVFSSAIAYVTWTYAFSKAKNTSSVTNYMFLTPFLTAIFGIILAKEVPDLSTMVGGIIIIIGMFIYNFSDKIIEKIRK